MPTHNFFLRQVEGNTFHIFYGGRLQFEIRKMSGKNRWRMDRYGVMRDGALVYKSTEILKSKDHCVGYAKALLGIKDSETGT